MGYLLGCQVVGDLESTELGEGESHLKDSKRYRGDLPGGKMHPHKVMQHPVCIESTLQSFGVLGICIGATPIAGEDTSEGTVKGFEVVGMNLRFPQVLSGLGVFLLGGLVFGAFGASLMGLGAFVLDAHFDALFQRGRGTSHLPSSDHLLTDSEQVVPIPTFSIRQQCQGLRLLDDLDQCLDRLLKERLRSFATSQFPDEARGAVHQHDGPTFGLLRGAVLMNFGVQLIPFNELLQKLMAQRIEKQVLFEITQTPHPARDAFLADVERPARRIDSHPVVERIEDRADPAERGA